MSTRMSDNGLETLSSIDVDPKPVLTLYSTQYYRKEDMVKMLLYGRFLSSFLKLSYSQENIFLLSTLTNKVI